MPHLCPAVKIIATCIHIHTSKKVIDLFRNIYIFIAIALDENIFLDVLHLRNEFHFSGVHGAMNRSG